MGACRWSQHGNGWELGGGVVTTYEIKVTHTVDRRAWVVHRRCCSTHTPVGSLAMTSLGKGVSDGGVVCSCFTEVLAW